MVSSASHSLAIIVPVYNSQDKIESTYGCIRDLLSIADIENPLIVFVNDASTDDTLVHLRRCTYGDPGVSILSMERNAGQHGAVYTGIAYARAQYYMTIDDDFPYAPSEVASLLSASLRSGCKISFGIPDSHKQYVAMILKVFFPRHRRVSYHSSLRVFDKSVQSRIANSGRFYPAMFLQWRPSDIHTYVMHSYRNPPSARYNTMRYLAFYKIEIAMMLTRVWGIAALVLGILTIYDRAYACMAGLSILFCTISYLISIWTPQDYSGLRYQEVVNKSK